MNKVLSVEGLTVEFATPEGTVRAVDSVSLALDTGARLGIVGESGSGKSVLSRTIMGLTRAGSARIRGSVVIDGVDLLARTEKQRRQLWGRTVTMVFQDPSSALHPIIPVGEQIAEAVRRGPQVSRSEARDRALELLKTVGISMPSQRYRARAHELSGGMRQRVAIAMAVAAHPKLIIADEPTTALDVTVQARVLELFDALCAEHGIALILISHDLGVVANHTDELAVMYAGRFVETGSVHNVFTSPRMRYTTALMSARPSVGYGERKLPIAIPGSPPSLSHLPTGCRFNARCEFASERCLTEEPMLRPIDGEKHTFACWHPVAKSQVQAYSGGGVRS